MFMEDKIQRQSNLYWYFSTYIQSIVKQTAIPGKCKSHPTYIQLIVEQTEISDTCKSNPTYIPQFSLRGIHVSWTHKN